MSGNIIVGKAQNKVHDNVFKCLVLFDKQSKKKPQRYSAYDDIKQRKV